MKNQSTSLSTPAERPSKLKAFLGSFTSGAVNGAIMLGIYSLVAPMLGMPALIIAAPMAALATIITTGLFSGFMGVKRAMSREDEHQPTQHSAGKSHVLVPVMAQGIAPQMEIAEEPESAPSQNWASRVSQNTGAQTRIDQILANGSLSDKNRAAAILAERQNAAQTGQSIG